MMKMLKFSRLAVLVACIAAFASGCGGGGGGSATTPVMECPEGQVGTYPDCMDPGPTDEQRIATARETIAGIVNDANTIEQAARSAVTAVEASADATVQQIANARTEGNAALDALRAIVRASGVANAATTAAAAEGAVASARAALTDLSNARSAAVGIRSDVDAVANLREREAEENRLATNGSSLIQHVRDNKLVYDVLLMNLGGTGSTTGNPVTDTIEVGAAGSTTTNADNGTATCVAPCAVFPADSGPSSARVVGDRKVQIEGTVSDSKTPTLTGTGRLPYGFDLKNATGNFVNAYTDITKTRLVSTRINGNNLATDETEEFYMKDQAVSHSDYLLAGIWIDATTDTTTRAIRAFAYGGEPIADAAQSTFCTAAENFPPDKLCATGDIDFDGITGFVDTDKDMTATYRGDANGAYLAGGAMSYFTADVAFTAEFQNAGGVGKGSIQGKVTNITAAGKSIAGSIELQKQSLGTDSDRNNISTAFTGDAIGVVAGKSYSGAWVGQFFGLEAGSTTSTEGTVTTTTYKAQAPRSVAGAFHVTQQSNPAGSTAFIGAFGAHR